ncbi:uncharacterized protein AMSG_04000 [Thecamonas trahens ATCC 50062]|uniref:G-protein coupled receptors family 2 profile 2 domain-containing protein n=1 Tax=Thecamonas trahens ATCC 50062 TaxID=461836 RepID=A0A0L0D904_THETB|nr:hypothetical protein AMSG_04000 [Thecamonas trahens ATCC 50062]KNC47773.1 hypothetical protein AMSG_04000 [Thecamonas trahens ATCC 50062]|eukprot:XP_013759251.1 hypothetical protein AMSG_04000 [Thecamonas trahens ATCC 50062]
MSGVQHGVGEADAKPGWSDNQAFAVRAATLSAGSITLIASLAEILVFLSKRKLRTGGGPLVLLFWLAVSDAFTGAATLAGGIFPPNTSGTWCTIQAFTLQTSNLAAVGWTLAVVHNLYVVVCRMDLDYARFFKYYHMLIWLLVLILGFLPLRIYGPAGVWCWIGSRHVAYRLLFYVPLVSSFPIMLGVLVRGRYVLRARKDSLTPLLASRRRKLYWRVFVLSLIFVFSWTAAITNRTLEHFGHSYFVAALLEAAMDPLQGFLNAWVFFRIPKVRNELGGCCGMEMTNYTRLPSAASSVNGSSTTLPLSPGVYSKLRSPIADYGSVSGKKGAGTGDYSSAWSSAGGHVYLGRGAP